MAGDESIKQNSWKEKSQTSSELVRLDFLEFWAEKKVSCWRKIRKFEFLYIFPVLMMFLEIIEPESEILLNCPISWKSWNKKISNFNNLALLVRDVV